MKWAKPYIRLGSRQTKRYGAAMSEALPTGGFEWVRTFFIQFYCLFFFSCITSEENENLLLRRTVECKRLLVFNVNVQRLRHTASIHTSEKVTVLLLRSNRLTSCWLISWLCLKMEKLVTFLKWVLYVEWIVFRLFRVVESVWSFGFWWLVAWCSQKKKDTERWYRDWVVDLQSVEQCTIWNI